MELKSDSSRVRFASLINEKILLFLNILDLLFLLLLFNETQYKILV